MRKTTRTSWLLLAGLALLWTQCGGNPERGGLERLRQESKELRAKLERLERENRQLRGQPATAEEVYAHFANDTAQGTLAGLLPGDELAQARYRFGQENRSRSWKSEGRTIFQYEWELPGGLTVRVNTDSNQRVERIAVVLEGTQPVRIPTLAGLTLGQETFASLQQRFPGTLSTSLQLWGAQGLYTVAQATPLADSRRRLEFVYEMPAGLSQAELDRIGQEVQQRRNAAVLEAHLRNRSPFLVALEEVR